MHGPADTSALESWKRFRSPAAEPDAVSADHGRSCHACDLALLTATAWLRRRPHGGSDMARTRARERCRGMSPLIRHRRAEPGPGATYGWRAIQRKFNSGRGMAERDEGGPGPI